MPSSLMERPKPTNTSISHECLRKRVDFVNIACGLDVIRRWKGTWEQAQSGLIGCDLHSLFATTGGKPMPAIRILLVFGVLVSWLIVSAVAEAQEHATPPAPESKAPGIAAAGPVAQLQPFQNQDDPKLAQHFSGRVIGPDGKPVNKAKLFVVRFFNSNSGPMPSIHKIDVLAVRAETKAEGIFEFDAPDMTYNAIDGLPRRRACTVIATADGYAADWASFDGSESSTFPGWVNPCDLTLRLGKGDVPIHGRFLDADGQPLAGARVQVNQLMIPLKRDLDAHLELVKNLPPSFAEGPDYERWLFHPELIPGLTGEVQTDADGRFTLKGMGRDRLVALDVSAPSVIANHWVVVMTRDGSDVEIGKLPNGKANGTIYGAGFTLQLQRAKSISGVVLDRDTRHPIPGMIVGSGSGYARDGVRSNQTVTDALGHFTITGLDPDSGPQKITAQSAPGMAYKSAAIEVEGNGPVIIQCRRGIPFHLKLVDEQGNPVEAEVTYCDVRPNPNAPSSNWFPCRTPLSRAAQTADGSYQGFVVPGPGAVLVRTPDREDYRPACVDPKAFFAPGRTQWTEQEQISDYGNRETVITSIGWLNQDHYAAIVLVNPSADSGPLELQATVIKDRPRQVSLLDSDGKPVVGVKAGGLTATSYNDPPLRAATFPLSKLQPDFGRRITFVKEDRQLIGFLLAKGDSDAPYTVHMQPWGAVTLRIVDDEGKPFPADPPVSIVWWRPHSEIENNAEVGDSGHLTDQGGGKYCLEELVPGQRYTARIYRGFQREIGLAFENLVIQPGEVRDLGEIRMKPPAVTMSPNSAAPSTIASDEINTR
jgi:hypothetical protein